MSEDAVGYETTHAEVLQEREVIRRRPGMYVGSTGGHGPHQLPFEAVDRAVNEALAGRAATIDVSLTPDGGLRVAHDGPGFPGRGRRRHRHRQSRRRRPC
ncbi:hypothetical protein [Streptomyces sp. NPDC054783]